MSSFEMVDNNGIDTKPPLSVSRKKAEWRNDGDSFEFIKDRLYYMPSRGKPNRTRMTAFFNIDDELVYWNFFEDFGPLNLGQLYRFCEILSGLMADPNLAEKRLVFYSSTRSDKQANAAFLICAYAVLHLNATPEEAFRPFEKVDPPFRPFRDASPFHCSYKLTILHCLKGLYKARAHQFFDFSNFDVEEYEYYERVENGDLNWLMKDRFLAFAGPFDKKRDTGDGYLSLTPEDYIPYFKKHNVTLVIRLNNKCYDERRFQRAGIAHLDMFFVDGSCPPQHIVTKFLQVCEATKGAIAVHCKAGLGRTGTLIGAYMMKHFGFTAAEAIGWMRICRPGSVIGPQQDFLEENEKTLIEQGRLNQSCFKWRNNCAEETRMVLEAKDDQPQTQGDFLRLRKVTSMCGHE